MEIEKFIKSLAKKAKLGGRYSTANTYIYTLHSYQKFAGKDSLTFEEITPESIKEYEQYLLLSGKRHNTISLYMRMLRSICNQAIEQNFTQYAGVIRECFHRQRAYRQTGYFAFHHLPSAGGRSG